MKKLIFILFFILSSCASMLHIDMKAYERNGVTFLNEIDYEDVYNKIVIITNGRLPFTLIEFNEKYRQGDKVYRFKYQKPNSDEPAKEGYALVRNNKVVTVYGDNNGLFDFVINRLPLFSNCIQN